MYLRLGRLRINLFIYQLTNSTSSNGVFTVFLVLGITLILCSICFCHIPVVRNEFVSSSVETLLTHISIFLVSDALMYTHFFLSGSPDSISFSHLSLDLCLFEGKCQEVGVLFLHRKPVHLAISLLNYH